MMYKMGCRDNAKCVRDSSNAPRDAIRGISDDAPRNDLLGDDDSDRKTRTYYEE